MEDEKMKLQECLALFQKRTFQPGDFVTWAHPAMKNAANPEIGQVGIVIQMNEPPRPNTGADFGSNHFADCPDVDVAIIDPADGAFEVYAKDSRRMVKVG